MAPHLEVEVGSGGISRMPAEADGLSVLPPPRPSPPGWRRGGRIRKSPPPVVQPDHVPVAAHGPGEPDSASGHGPDRCSVRNPNVHASMEIGPQPQEADSIGRDKRSLHGPSRDGATGRRRSPARRRRARGSSGSFWEGTLAHSPPMPKSSRRTTRISSPSRISFSPFRNHSQSVSEPLPRTRPEVWEP